MSTTWYVAVDGQSYGPLELETARRSAWEQLSAGRAVYVARPGVPEWKPAAEVWPDLAPAPRMQVSPTQSSPPRPGPEVNASGGRRVLPILAFAAAGVVVVGLIIGLMVATMTPLPEPEHEYVAAVCESCGKDSRVCAAAMGVEYALPATCSAFVDGLESEPCEMYWGPDDAASHDDYDLVSLIYYTCANKSLDSGTISRARRLMQLYHPADADRYVTLRRSIARDAEPDEDRLGQGPLPSAPDSCDAWFFPAYAGRRPLPPGDYEGRHRSKADCEAAEKAMRKNSSGMVRVGSCKCVSPAAQGK